MKVGEGGRNMGGKSIFFPVFGFFKRIGGTFCSFGAGGQELFW